MDGSKTVKVDVFSGFWRLAVVLMVLWVAGCLAYGFMSNTSASANLVVWDYGATPVLDDKAVCTKNDASTFFNRQIDDHPVYGQICFKARPSDTNELLVPYASAGSNGMVWMLGADSDQVRSYKERVASDFSFSDDQLSEIKGQLFSSRITALWQSLVAALGGALLIFCITKVIGWVARGFVQRQA